MHTFPLWLLPNGLTISLFYKFKRDMICLKIAGMLKYYWMLNLWYSVDIKIGTAICGKQCEVTAEIKSRAIILLSYHSPQGNKITTLVGIYSLILPATLFSKVKI